ncbi:MAG: metallophosphoesterase [Bacteroidetes bacterium]|nr:metallophosphoesterase [Bacteroidota bacterium]
MKKGIFIKIISLFIFTLFIQNCAVQDNSKDFSFIISSDQRSHATEKYHTMEYTLGGYKAIEELGKGSFMIVLGDMDPPEATDNLIKEVLGEDYPWYPVIGNHDMEKENNLEYLRELNRGAKSYTNLVRKGPAGCEETTYSFDRGDFHFVVLNVYYDGKSDKGTDGNIVPELLEWLDNDLKENSKKYVIVFGHEPVYSVLDLENGSQRHLGDSLDKYPIESLNFVRLLLKHDVLAYMSGHTHSASYANFNGLWLINSGHIYGQEGDFTPDKCFAKIRSEILKENNSGKSYKNVIQDMYYEDYDTLNKWKEYKKLIFNFGYGDGYDYKNIPDTEVLERLYEFYTTCNSNENAIENYMQLFWKNTEWRKSTFLKIYSGKDAPVLEYYRDKDYYGNYELTHKIVLN